MKAFKFFTLIAVVIPVVAFAQRNSPTGAIAVVMTKEVQAPLKNFCEADANGVCYMRLMLAKEYCERQSARLPTAREFAELAVSRGATQIDSKKREGVYQSRVNARNTDGSKDKFFLNHDGHRYSRPQSEPGSLCLWSSSRMLSDSGKAYGGDVYTFNNNTGLIVPRRGDHYVNSHASPVLCAVTCVYEPVGVTDPCADDMC